MKFLMPWLFPHLAYYLSTLNMAVEAVPHTDHSAEQTKHEKQKKKSS